MTPAITPAALRTAASHLEASARAAETLADKDTEGLHAVARMLRAMAGMEGG